jgi:Xaa-Pro aminopeptidase
MSLRNSDVEYEFRQDSDFLWLTGLASPDAVAVLCPSHPEHPYVLFVRPRDADAEVWEGPRLGPEGACSVHGADAAFPLGELAQRLPDLVGRSERVVMALGRDPELERKVWSAGSAAGRKWREGLVHPSIVEDPRRTLHELRLHKDEGELSDLRRAAAITVEAHRAAMRKAAPGLFEWEVQVELEGVMRREGVRRMAYESIVASGPNATFLHYVKADRQMQDGDLVLIDAGAEWNGYAADVTRTFPVGGRFSAPQRDVYEVVLQAQFAAIAQCVAGTARSAAHEAALRVLVEGLVALEVLKGDVDSLIEEEAYKPYYMHGTGHWLGMDVHDVGDYVSLDADQPSQTDGLSARNLAPGMVTTVEPGLYFPADAEEVPEALRGIGIRIEDDVVITDGGPEVMTAALPKQLDDVEAACSS